MPRIESESPPIPTQYHSLPGQALSCQYAQAVLAQMPSLLSFYPLVNHAHDLSSQHEQDHPKGWAY